tara:strand:+ start:640 stop:1011 length:372 start_codon:yes stop_codon:yes gene_type:complete
MSVASFNADLEKFAKTTDLELETVVRKVAFDVYKGITQKTPVDTGRAKANWNIGLGAIDSSITENTTFTALPLPKGSGKRPIYITNNLPYIGKLENGSSKQAPTGMVRLTMSSIQRSISNVIR